VKLSFHTPEFNYLAFARTPGLTLAFAQIESVPTIGGNVDTISSGKAIPSEEKLKQIRKLLNNKKG